MEAYFVTHTSSYECTLIYLIPSLVLELILATLLLLDQLNVLPYKIDNHVLKGLRLDTKLLFCLTRVGR